MRVRGRISGRVASSIATIIVVTATTAAADGRVKPPALSQAAVALGCGEARTLCVQPPPYRPAGGLVDGVACPGEMVPKDLRAGDELRVFVIRGELDSPCVGAAREQVEADRKAADRKAADRKAADRKEAGCKEADRKKSDTVTVVMSGRRRPVPWPSAASEPGVLWHGAAEVSDIDTFTVRVTRRAEECSPDTAVVAIFSLVVGAGRTRQEALPAVLPHDAPTAGDVDVHALARTRDGQHDLDVGFELGITNHLFAGLSQGLLFNVPRPDASVDGLGDGLAKVGVRSRPTQDLHVRFTLSGTLPTASRALGPRERTVGASLAVGHLVRAESRDVPLGLWIWWQGGVVHDRRAADETAQSSLGGSLRLHRWVDVALNAEASIEQHYADAGDHVDVGMALSLRVAPGQWGYVFLGVHDDDAGPAITAGLETRISLRARHRSRRSSQ